MIAMEAFGRALALEPFLATVVLGGGFLRHGGSAEQCAALIPKIARRQPHSRLRPYRAAVALRSRRYRDAERRATAPAGCSTARRGWSLHGDTADKLIVTARVGGGRRDRDGVGVFIVDGTAAGVSRRGYPTQDGLRAAEIALSGVRVGTGGRARRAGRGLAAGRAGRRRGDRGALRRGGRRDGGHARVDRRLSRRRAGNSAARSAASRCLQHRAVDMLVALEQARSMAMFATMIAAAEDAARAARCRRGGQGADRPFRQAGRAAGDPAAWRDRHDDGVQGRPLFQADDDDRYDVRRRRSSSARACPPQRAGAP